MGNIHVPRNENNNSTSTTSCSRRKICCVQKKIQLLCVQKLLTQEKEVNLIWVVSEFHATFRGFLQSLQEYAMTVP